MDKQQAKVSKFLSYILRHEPEAIGLILDQQGWANIDTLISCAAESGTMLNRDLIEAVVQNNDKKRFAISEDGQSIRAVQGHSTESVAISHIEKQPPQILYHGTASRFLVSIQEQGLLPGSRHHVHLSEDIATATAVGQRYGQPVIIKIKAMQMYEEGYKFYQADNGVWLTENVPVGFLAQ